jgi:hypothetical protein
MVNYFGITPTTRDQLKYLDHLGYRWFRRLLLQKYSSAHKTHSLVKRLHYTKDWRVCEGSVEQLKTIDIKPFSNVPLNMICRNEDVLMANIYLERLKLNKH